MKVRVFYTTQLKVALDRASEQVDIPGPLTVGQLLQHLHHLHGKPFAESVLTSQGELRPSILVCVGTDCLGRDLSVQLNDGDEVTLLSPVSGG